ncbi:MAG: hypothetical protein ACRD15_03405 [Vicinamibacterales bacterium]
MLNRWSILFLLVGAIGGHVFAGRSVKAQSSVLPFEVGDQIMLTRQFLTDPIDHHRTGSI